MLAGGQSLIPMLKLRFASPEMLVDINNIPGLGYLEVDADGTIRVGALCRHADLERSPLLASKQPTMAAAAPLVADPIVRNRGTLVGSLCHADPQGDWASVVTALGGHVVAHGPTGRRTIPVSEFVSGPFQNVLAIDEIAVEAVIPAPKGDARGRLPQARASRRRLRHRRCRRRASSALADSITRAGIALTGVGASTIDAAEAAQALVGGPLTAASIEQAAELAAQAARPRTDHRGSAEFKRHIVHTFVVRTPHPRRRVGGKGGLTMTSLFEEISPEPAADVPVRRVTITLNGERRAADVEPRLLLAHLLRQGFRLTGTHTGCDTTNCGVCTVLFDGVPVKSCTMLAVQADGHEVTTVEGLATASELHPIQEGFKDEHGLQCGFCTPGMMLADEGAARREPRSRPRTRCAGRCRATSAAAPGTRTS